MSGKSPSESPPPDADDAAKPSTAKRDARESRMAAIVVPIVVALAGAVAPVISAVKSNPPGNGVVGTTITVLTNFPQYWVQGVKNLTHLNVADPSPLPRPAPAPSRADADSGADAKRGAELSPEPTAIGRLYNNVSFMDGATLDVGPSRVARTLTFALLLRAAPDGDNLGHLSATLKRDGHVVCSVSVNSQTSQQGDGKSRYNQATCQDVVPASAHPIYSANVIAVKMSPLSIDATAIDASKR